MIRFNDFQTLQSLNEWRKENPDVTIINIEEKIDYRVWYETRE